MAMTKVAVFAAAAIAMAGVSVPHATAAQVGETATLAARGMATDFSSQNRNAQQRRAAPARANRPAGNAARRAGPPANMNRGNMNRGNVNRAQINRGNMNRGQMNRGQVNRGQMNRGQANRGQMNRGQVNRTAPARNVAPNATNRQNAIRQMQRQGARNAGANRSRAVTSTARMRSMPSRGAGRAMVRGRNFSVWRGGGYRVRHGNSWRTFAALSALGALTFGAATYYPYAYISAPQPYCEGLTADGCELAWRPVQTIEGDVIGQCVAYCPWQ